MLQSNINKTAKTFKSLSEDEKNQIWLSQAMIDNSYDAAERLETLLNEAQHLISQSATPIKSNGKGSPKQEEKRGFIEAVIQVFEKAKGLQIERLDKISTQNRRRTKSDFYRLLHISVFNSSNADENKKSTLNKFADRYIASERQGQKDIAKNFKDHIKEQIRG